MKNKIMKIIAALTLVGSLGFTIPNNASAGSMSVPICIYAGPCLQDL